MNLERVVFGFVIILALSFTFAFTVGEIDNPAHHNVWLLTIAILVWATTRAAAAGTESGPLDADDNQTNRHPNRSIAQPNGQTTPKRQPETKRAKAHT